MPIGVTRGRRTITIQPQDLVTDFDITKWGFPNGIRLSAVDFQPSQDGESLIMREGSATGPVTFTRRIDTTGGGFHKAVGGRSLRVKPYIKASEQSWGVPTGVTIVLEYD